MSWVFLAVVVLLVLVLTVFVRKETYQSSRPAGSDVSYVYNTYTRKYEKVVR